MLGTCERFGLLISAEDDDSMPPGGGRAAAAGVSIDNYKTSLPTKKGLSSSAAVCVLVVRALALIYGLELSLPQV